MEATPAAPTGARNGGFAMPTTSSSSSQPSRKEWRAISEHSIRNSGDEVEISAQGSERSKLVQSDERLIYEVRGGREPVDVDFCSITIDGGLDSDIMQQRILAVAKQREELQQMEIELRAHVITRSEIEQMKSKFETQTKEHADAKAKLQEQLHEKEHKMHELERKMDEKERELHAIRLDTEAAWAKDDLLREQSKELQSFMRDKDNSEAERVQHIQQIHDLQEHCKEKDRLFMELQEQHRIAQETIIFKDEQLREAQAWMTRAQEMDALQSSTNHTLQLELRERTEHYNQLWLGCQRQFAEMERLHMHLQQLQLELVDARERSGVNEDGSHTSQTNLNTASELGNSNGSKLEMKSDASQIANSSGLQSENSENAPGGNISTLGDHAHVVAFAPSSLRGMSTYIPNGQMTALHPFIMQQQGVPHPHLSQSHLNSVPATSAQNWQNQQSRPDGQHGPIHSQYPQEPEQNMLRTNSLYGYETSGNGQILSVKYSDSNISRGLDADSVRPSPNGEGQVLDSIDKTYDNNQSPQSLQEISSQFREALSLDSLEHGKDTKVDKPVIPVSDHGIEIKNAISEHSNHAVNTSSFEAAANSKSIIETTADSASTVDLTDTPIAAGQKNNVIGKYGDSYLLDQRALLACIARTIGSSVRIRISTTLPNRLAKMLAPLHWHDYKRKYGKLDEFVARHLELFYIEGDYIQLREGAQETIAATAAVAEVAAAAPSLYSSLFPTVSLTPMAHSQQMKTTPSLESLYANADKAHFNEFAGPKPNNGGHPSQLSAVQTSQNLNGGPPYCVAGGSNVRILSKGKDHLEMNGSAFSQTKGASHGRPGVRYQMGNNRTGHIGGQRHV